MYSQNEPQQIVLRMVINSATANVDGTNIGSLRANRRAYLARKNVAHTAARRGAHHYAGRAASLAGLQREMLPRGRSTTAANAIIEA